MGWLFGLFMLESSLKLDLKEGGVSFDMPVS